jgi:hypothetical protein
MSASPTERNWCVLEFARCNTFVAVQRAFRRQFGRRGPPETSNYYYYYYFMMHGTMNLKLYCFVLIKQFIVSTCELFVL